MIAQLNVKEERIVLHGTLESRCSDVFREMTAVSQRGENQYQ